jgi:uncharacterized DUF497 family protein
VDTFSGLDWDAGNLLKCQKHGVSVQEIEELFYSKPLFSPVAERSPPEKRFVAVGTSGEGRMLFVIFTFREIDGDRLARPISARYMHAKEAKLWLGKFHS